jgi:SpoVK/Ycf46/Vps4 family AAA+-type ATPase
MALAERLSEYIEACFTGLWIVSHEHEDALAEITQLCHRQDWRLATWDLAQGLVIQGQAAEGASDPLAALRATAGLAQNDGSAVMVLVNFHRFLMSSEIIQTLACQIAIGKQSRTFVVILSPVLQIPPELEKQFIVLDHDLPNRAQILEIARGVVEGDDDLPCAAELDRVLDAAAGLSRYEAEGAFSLALVRHNRIVPETIWELKAQTLLKSGLMQLHRGDERFDQLGGLDALKSFCLRAMRRQGSRDPDRRPRGVLLLGVPGTGKSAFAKALGTEVGRPTLVLDIGSLLGSLVGQSEQNIRQALKIVDAMAPAVAFIDEVEKALGGAGGGQGDSGVSARLFGTLLTWLNDHESDVFVVATCNDISRLPPEFSRAERFDGIFFIDLPSPVQKRAIWNLYLQKYDLEKDQSFPPDEEFTGAEIRACCRLAALLDLPLTAAAKNVIPVARTASESVARLRQWASGRCLDAERGGVYEAAAKAASSRRRVSRGSVDPSAN